MPLQLPDENPEGYGPTAVLILGVVATVLLCAWLAGCGEITVAPPAPPAPPAAVDVGGEARKANPPADAGVGCDLPPALAGSEAFVAPCGDAGMCAICGVRVIASGQVTDARWGCSLSGWACVQFCGDCCPCPPH